MEQIKRDVKHNRELLYEIIFIMYLKISYDLYVSYTMEPI